MRADIKNLGKKELKKLVVIVKEHSVFLMIPSISILIVYRGLLHPGLPVGTDALALYITWGLAKRFNLWYSSWNPYHSMGAPMELLFFNVFSPLLALVPLNVLVLLMLIVGCIGIYVLCYTLVRSKVAALVGSLLYRALCLYGISMDFLCSKTNSKLL